MTFPVTWPLDLLWPRTLSAVPLFATASGNPTLNGTSQVTSSHAERWKIVANGFVLTRPEQILLWRSIEGMLGGRQNQVVVPIFEAGRVPILGSVAPVPHDDGTYFSDGTGYQDRIYSAESASRVDLFSTSMTINFVGSIAPKPGQKFSIQDRLYRINRILSRGTNAVTIDFGPTAREEIPSGAYLNFDRPTCLCRLATDSEMALDNLDFARRIEGVNVLFIEDTSKRRS